MKNRYVQSFLSASLSIVPMILIICILSWTGVAPLNFARGDYWLLLIGMVVLIVGLAVFSIGASSSLTKVGEYMGASLSKQKNLFIVIAFAFALGSLITVAEPSIMIVSKQVTNDPAVGYMLTGGIALGVGIFVVIGVLRIIFHKSLKIWYLLFYALTFMILIFIFLITKDDQNKSVFLPFIFDSGGVTTGPITVPFIMALGVGVATIIGGKHANENSFGLIALCSVGPMIAVMIVSLGSSGALTYVLPDYSLDLSNIGHILLKTFLDVLKALGLIVVFFFILQYTVLKLPKTKLRQLV